MGAGFRQDLRHALRSLAKSPAFVFTTLISLALGIGINTSIFSIIHTAMERPVSGRTPRELVDLSLATPAGYMSFSFPEYLEIRNRAQAFTEVIGLMPGRYRISGQGRPEIVNALVATPNFFTGFQHDPFLGRGFSHGAASAGEVVLGERFWRRRFGADPRAIGKSLVVYEGDKRFVYSIVGVLSRDFRYATMWTPDFVVPFPDDPVLRKGDVRPISVMARLKPGLSMGQAQAETELLAKQLAPLFPESFGKAKIAFWPKVRRDAATRAVASIMQAVVGLVLLIACANVVNLLLARHQARRLEIATRLALGSSRGRLIRQLLTESLLLAIPSALAGYGLAALIIQIVETIPIPGLEGIQMYFYLDGTVLAFALCAGAAASVLTGLWPARAASRLDLMAAIKDGAGAMGQRKFGLRGALVAAQLALSMVGITASAMLARSVWKLDQFDAGVDPQRVLTATMWPVMNGYKAEKAASFRIDLETRLMAQPGVRAVTFAAAVPGGNDSSRKVAHTGSALLPRQETVPVRSNPVAPGFFRVLGIDILRGREYAEADMGGRLLCIVNDAMARRFWPGQDPLGQTVRLMGAKPIEYQVIGVARDTAYDRNLDEARAPFLYLPLTGTDFLTVLVQTSGRADPFAEPLRRIVAALDPDMPLQTVAVLAERLTGGPNGTELRLRAGLMAVLGGTALLLSALGLFGVVTWLVSRRTREIGIRLALGASRADILRAVLTDGFRLIGVGMAAGIALSLVVCPLLANHLFGVTPNHPGVIAASCGILAGIALLAMFVPARRAAKMDALVALRYE